jgi:uncharacterized membrane-anchored protein
MKRHSKRLIYHLKFFALAVGVVLVWRGIWELAGRYLFPSHPDLSAILSIVIGMVILLLTDRKLNELL